MKRETAPCQHDNSITQTQPRKGLDNHSPSAASLRTGAQLKKKTYAVRTENRPLSLGVRFNLFSLCACSVTKAVVQYRYIKIISSWEAIT